MQKAMIDFADGTRENGLLLIGSPTAAGKTHSAANFILEEYLKNPKQKIFYLTTLKANIEGFVKEAREAFNKAGLENRFDEASLILSANFDCVIAAFKDEGFLKEISEEKYHKITHSREYGALFRAAKSYILSSKLKKVDGVDLLEQSRKAVEDAERPFRVYLSQIVAEFGKTASARFDYIKRVFPAILKLYPAIKTNKRSIYLMTIDKFYLGNNSIVEPPYKFISSDLIKGAIVIIDEIDSCKTSLLRQQIRESDRYKIDPISLVKTLGAQLQAIKLRKSMMTIPTFYKKKEGRPNLTPERCVQDIKRFVDGTYVTNHLEYAIKLDETYQDHGAPFVFKDDGILTIGDSKKTEVYVLPDNIDNCNFIKCGKIIPEGAIPLMRYLLSINNCVSSFAREAAVLADYYRESQNEIRKEQGKELLDIASATSSILGAFELSQQQIDALNYSVTAAAFDIKTGGRKGDLIYYDFYQEGFTFFGFRDEPSNDLRTTVSLIQLKETPEYFLYRLASQAKVVGLSATCLIDSPISNFDLDYVKSNLGDAYVNLTTEELSRMRTHFIEERQKNNRADIRVVGCGDLGIDFKSEEGVEKMAASLFQREQSREFFINQLMSRSTQDYAKKQLFKLLQALEDFYLDDKVRSLIIMRNNSLSTDGEALYSLDTLDKFLKLIQKDRQIGKTFIILPFASVHSSTINAQMREARNHYDKVIVATTYPSAGIGQNLQFVLSSESEAATEGEDNSYDQREEDINCIYLEKPTHILVNVHPNEQSMLETSDLLEAVYQYKAMHRIGELSRAELFTGIKAAVRRTHFRNDGNDPTRGNYQPIKGVYEKPSVSKAALKILNQAVGRICRTTRKPKGSEVVIYYDEEIAKFDFSIFDGKLLNREFEELVKKLRRKPSFNENYDMLTARVESDCANIERHLNALLAETSAGWSRRNMRQWNDIRVFVVKNPVIDETQYADLPSNYRHFYIDTKNTNVNRYWFQKLDDNGEINNGLDSFQHLRIFFEPTVEALEVSEQDCGLSKIAKVPELRSFFEEHGYATSFRPGRYILNPIVYTNIYKGMLGEICGRRIFECCGIVLDEIEDGNKFEKFDFKIHDEEIYVDFKNWHIGTSFEEKKSIEKFRDKLKAVGGNLGLVVNLFQYHSLKNHDYGNIMTISGVLLDEPANGKFINGEAIRRILDKIKDAK